MLAKFSVSNYMGFPEKITWDLSHPRDYSFNTGLIKDGVLKNGIIYGENGSGKSSLGRAVMDIVNLVNGNITKYPEVIYQGARDKNMEFSYTFNFDGEIVEYVYSKNYLGQIEKEALSCNGQVTFERNENQLQIQKAFPVTQEILDNLSNSSNSVSILNFLYATFPLDKNHHIQKLMDFVNSMLWFRCLQDRRFTGLDTGAVNIQEYIIKNGYLKEFEDFLKAESGQIFDFSHTPSDINVIMCKLNGTIVPFNSIVSTGTASLELLFYWFKRMKEAHVKFVFIDEFDAFYHFELSLNVCRTLFKEDFQVFLTSHNTLLLSNDLLRPDCGFLIGKNKIAPLSDLTDRGELRQGHNIEKMFRAGAFNLK